MNGYNFTERVRKSLMLARREAVALRHEYVGTEHMLLGICAEGGGVAEAALTSLNVDLNNVRQAILQVVMPGQGNPGITSSDPDLPYTSRAKRALELAINEARDLNHSYVGTEHLLLGLMREANGIAAQVLTSLGMTATGVRTEVVKLLGTEPPSSTTAQKPAVTERVATITLVIEHPDGRIEAKKFGHAHDAVSFLKHLEL